jgi:acid-sensing ion channel, other
LNISTLNKGYKVAIHAPCEIPQFDKQYYRASLEKTVTMILRMTLTDTDADLRNYHISERHCYFENERKLAMFKVYTRRHCELECLANFTREQCECIHFSMPRLSSDKICDHSHLSCVIASRKNLSTQARAYSLSTSSSFADRGKLQCNCLPACTSFQYDVEVTQDDKKPENDS